MLLSKHSYFFILLFVLHGLQQCRNPRYIFTKQEMSLPCSLYMATPYSKKEQLPNRELAWLSYQDLLTICQKNNKNVPYRIAKKYHRLLRRVQVINNPEAIPAIKIHPKIGPYFSVTQWNIEKSLTIPSLVKSLQQQQYYQKLIAHANCKKQLIAMRQRQRLLESDIFFLQEMDVGVPRSNYIHAAKMLAKQFKMHCAYAIQSFELEPVIQSQKKQFPFLNDTKKHTLKQISQPVNKSYYKGAFGSAILSKYPIVYTEVTPLKTNTYDWFSGEKYATSMWEKSRKLGSKLVFRNRLYREIKIGSRHFFRVDVLIPDLSRPKVSQRVALINVHLEIKCSPKQRQAQLQEILAKIKDIPYPVILAGDFNSASNNLAPINLKKITRSIFKSPTSWLSFLVNITSQSPIINPIRNIFNFGKNLHNPHAMHIPIIAPNKVKPMFDDLRNFVFTDGGVFDHRGDKNRAISANLSSSFFLLGNSNEPWLQGKKPSFRVKQPLGPVGCFRLDWIFVKSGYLTNPIAKNGSYRLAPHYGETFSEFNSLPRQHAFSDHHPISVFITLKTAWNSKQKQKLQQTFPVRTYPRKQNLRPWLRKQKK